MLQNSFDILWDISLLLPTPSCCGMMQTIHIGHHPGAASIHYFPMIDLNPGDTSCILFHIAFCQ